VPARRNRTPLLIVWTMALVALVVIAIATKPSSASGEGERFSTGAPSFTPVRSFTPQTLHEAILGSSFPQGLLPSGFSFEPQKSPGGKPYPAQAFSSAESAQRHRSVGAAVVALTTGAPDHAHQITYLSFADPQSAEAYMQEARNAVGTQAPVGQPVCGTVGAGVVVGCSVAVENVVVEGRVRSTANQPVTDPNALPTANNLAHAGVTHLRQIKGG
jgi:hypothetical protein